MRTVYSTLLHVFALYLVKPALHENAHCHVGRFFHLAENEFHNLTLPELRTFRTLS